MRTTESFVFRHSTRRIIFAAGALGSLAELMKSRRLRRAALVIDSFFLDTDVCEQVRGLVERNGAAFSVHAVPNQEPDTDTVEACRRFLAEFAPDCVLAIGGGSTMDTAKVARIMLSNPGDVAEAAGFDREFRPHPSLFVCMPTTAGTGSEVSEMAVVSLAGSDIKLRYRSQNMTAEVAMLDPELTVSAPPTVTAACGFDALTHAVEGFVSRLASPMTDPYTIDAVRRLARWLPVAFEEPENIAARGQCLLASTLAACAFNSTQLGLAHAIAAPLGALHHVAHGVANAFALPAVTAFNEPCLGEKGPVLAEALGSRDVASDAVPSPTAPSPTVPSPAVDSASAASGIASLRERLHLDRGLDEVVGTEEEREAIAVAALKSGNIPTNPREPTLADVRAVVGAMREPLQGMPPAERLLRPAGG